MNKERKNGKLKEKVKKIFCTIKKTKFGLYQ